MKNLLAIVLIVLLAIGYGSIFVVKEGTRSIVVRFGKVVQDDDGKTMVYTPGLHLKLAVFDKVKTLDARIQTLDEQPDRFVTIEKEDLIVDSYVKWKVQDFERYYLSTGGDRFQAESLLKQKVNNGLRSEFGSRTIKQIVSGERSELMDEAMKQASGSSDELGIQIIDVRVKQINLPTEISDSIFNRMRSERAAAAREYRSEGKEQGEIIRANIDAKVTIMLADAERNARQLRGEGDAQSAKIYAETFSKDPEFYSFLRSMDAYRSAFNSKQDVIVLEPDSEFFNYLNSQSGKK
ncbi:protease modulator HflC [Glaciecola sp. MF2-115]|uniref:protease modulator HflC n=1 Tax=Glaciecola sp. MF2-115 TaxID=3384827 RepID=UPI0039A27B69